MPNATLRKKLFEANSEITTSSMFNLANNTANTFSTSEYLSEPDPSDPSQFITFKFLFWSILGNIYTTTTVNIPNVGSADFEPIAWYLQIGGGGNGTAHVRTSAFSLGQSAFLPDTPISSVVPAAAWPSPTSKIAFTADSAVEIDAVNAFGQEEFDSWLVLGGNATVSGDDLSAAEDQSAFTIVFYKEKKRLPPDLRFELLEIIEKYRGFIGDWVTDPAPIDLARLTGEIARREALSQEQDELARLTDGIRSMGLHQLNSAKDELEAKATRLSTALKMVNAALKEQRSK